MKDNIPVPAKPWMPHPRRDKVEIGNSGSRLTVKSSRSEVEGQRGPEVNEMTHATIRATVLCFCLGLVCSVATQPEDKQKGKLVGESKSWRVEVVSAEYGLPGEEIPWDRGTYFRPRGKNECFLFLKLHLEYKGPNGDVLGPRVTLVNDRDEKFSNSGNLKSLGAIKMDMVEWLMSPTHNDPKELKTLALKTGEKVANPWLEFLIVIPIGSKDLRLIFGGEEISGIVVNPTKAK
jgi:hypothetical protein